MFERAMASLRRRVRGPYAEWAAQMQMTEAERRYIEDAVKGRQFLELGAGYSTLCFSRHAAQMVSVETRRAWFETLKGLLSRHGINNVDLKLFPPEPLAYTSDGLEKWNNRDTPKGSDYGTPEEFAGYMRGITELLDSQSFDVVLVDGNVRGPIVEYLRDTRSRARVLLHDVMPERDYLNDPILALQGVKLVRRLDTLVEFAIDGSWAR